MTPQHREREMHYFQLLSCKEQKAAIQRLANSGMSDYGIAAATALSVEQIRIVLGELKASAA